MSPYIKLLFFALFCCAACKKKETLDVSTFNVQVPAFYVGSTTPVRITTSLKDGEYIIYYRITDSKGSAIFDHLRAGVTISQGSSAYETPALSYPQCLKLLVDSVTSLSGLSATVNASSAFCDSNGVMTATINGKPFRTNHIRFDGFSGSYYVIGELGQKDSPGWSQLALPSDHHTIGQTVFSANQYLGYYFPPTITDGYPTNSTSPVSGVLTVTAIRPLLTGTFYFTANDGTTVENGNFAVRLPW